MNTGVDSLGWPLAWPRRSGAVWAIRIAYGLILAAILVVVVVLPLVFSSIGKLGAGLMTVGPAFLLVPTVVMQLFLVRTRFRKLPRVLRAGSDGVTGPVSLPDVSEIASVVTAAVMVAIFLPYVWVQTRQSVHVAQEVPVLWGILAIEWVLVGALALFAVWLGWNWWRVRPGLQISAAGVRRQTLLTDRTIAWDQVFRVDPERGVRYAVWLVGSSRFRVRRIGLFASEPREKTWAEPLIAAKYRIDPPLLLALLRYYHLHPEHRAELESAAARERIRNIDFPEIDLSHDPGIPRADTMRYAIRGLDPRSS